MTLMRRLQLGEDGLRVGINQQDLRLQALMVGLFLLMQRLPFGRRGAGTFTLERLELLLEGRLLGLKGAIGGEGCLTVFLQLGLFSGGQDAVVVMVAVPV